MTSRSLHPGRPKEGGVGASGSGLRAGMRTLADRGVRRHVWRVVLLTLVALLAFRVGRFVVLPGVDIEGVFAQNGIGEGR